MTGQLSNSATSNPTIIPLSQATDPVEVGHQADPVEVGHQAATLAALLSIGLPVPDGVVVPARTFYSAGAGDGAPDVPDELVAALADTVRSWGDSPRWRGAPSRCWAPRRTWSGPSPALEHSSCSRPVP